MNKDEKAILNSISGLSNKKLYAACCAVQMVLENMESDGTPFGNIVYNADSIYNRLTEMITSQLFNQEDRNK